MNLQFWKPITATEKRYQVVRREALKLSLAEWRSDPKLISEARKMFAQESFLVMLDVLRNENPAGNVLPIGTSANDRSVMQARGEGYHMAIANLEAMTREYLVPEPIEAGFDPEEINKQ
jgi:hypothetical protein